MTGNKHYSYFKKGKFVRGGCEEMFKGPGGRGAGGCQMGPKKNGRRKRAGGISGEITRCQRYQKGNRTGATLSMTWGGE